MLDSVPVQRQLTTGGLRVLVVGAGIAGLTVSQLLRRAGLDPVLVERAGPDTDRGYMLALMPLVDPVLRDLGVTERYLESSAGLHRYRIHGRSGAPLKEYSMTSLLSRFGDYRGLSRGALMEVVGSAGGAITHRTTVTALTERPDAVTATLTTGTEEIRADFDLVVVADGLHSTTRSLVLRPDQVTTFDSGWGGWVSWIEPDADEDLGAELWAAGAFVGTYPVKDRLGVIVGGPRSDTAVGPAEFVAGVRAGLRSVDPRIDKTLDAIAAGTDGQYYWSLTDCRSATWSTGRVVLLGDAAAGFLPTAGIGACMAMESAWMLAERIRTATTAGVAAALSDYEQTQRPRVEAAQDNSRQLARLLFRRNRPLAAVRDVAARFIPLETALGPIRRLLETQPSPAQPAGPIS